MGAARFRMQVCSAKSKYCCQSYAVTSCLPEETNLKGFIDVTALNGVLTQAGKPAVDAAGLDKAQG